MGRPGQKIKGKLRQSLSLLHRSSPVGMPGELLTLETHINSSRWAGKHTSWCMSSSSSRACQAGRLAPRLTLRPSPALPRGALLGGMLAAPRRPALKERWLRCVASWGLHTPLDHLSNSMPQHRWPDPLLLRLLSHRVGQVKERADCDQPAARQ